MHRLSLLRHLITCGLVFAALVESSGPVWAQEQRPRKTQEERAQRKEKLEQQLKQILDELDELQREEPPAEGGRTSAGTSIIRGRVEPEEPGVAPELELSDVSIVSGKPVKRPEGVTISATERSETTEQPTRHFRESLESLPGMVVRQGNGPRDFNISIRGSGAKTTFGIRNVKLYEDGISQTQSDGLSRLDLHDPWFMEGVEVLRGACSSMFDNYCLGGMVQFRTRRGKDINGVELLNAGGSYGFHKHALAVGRQSSNLDVALFGSYIGEDGFIQHSNYWTSTVNLNLRFRIDDRQTVYFKAINNDLWARVPLRLTFGQFRANPRQAGGLGTTTANSLDQGRRDRRTIIGGLYERQIGAHTVLVMEGDFDLKDIHQVFAQISDNTNPNFKHYTDLRHDGTLLGGPLRSYVGYFFNYMEQKGNTFTNLNNFTGTRGTLAQNSNGLIRNLGARIGEEWTFLPQWTAAARFNFEHSTVYVNTISYTAAGAVSSRAGVNRDFNNYAPEFALTYRPTDQQRYWARYSTGYAIPGFGNLTTDPTTGLAGTNFDLKPQRNMNFELGGEGRLHERFSMQLVGFWIFFENEIITQTVTTPVGGTGSISVNAPESQYRGVEVSWTWLPAAGWRWTGAYTHMDSKYVKFVDQLNLGGTITQINQAGHAVPAVEKNVLNSKVSYEHPTGWGGWVEASWVDSFFVNNNNTLKTPAYWLFNLNVHDTYHVTNNSFVKFAKTYFELDNVFNKIYVASAVPISDATPDGSKQAFFAGYGRAFYAGLTLGF
ncbi:TonB-dependent receptor family protein [Nitrospira sp. Kam-Ns4a]